MRLNKYLALCGVASRRKCDILIEKKKVLINGKIAQIGAIIEPEKDEVVCQEKKVTLKEKVYYLFNKPINVLTTLSDPFFRSTIQDFLQSISERVFPVGRLDFDSHGLLLLTNDGNLAHKIQHPKYEIHKVYEVIVDKMLTQVQENTFTNGVILEEGTTSNCELKKIEFLKYEVILHQGWNRQIRRMFETFGVTVLDLQRIQIGNLVLKGLELGQYRMLSTEEEKNLKKILF